MLNLHSTISQFLSLLLSQITHFYIS